MKLNLSISLLSYAIAVVILSLSATLYAKSCEEGEYDCRCIYTYREGGTKHGRKLVDVYESDHKQLRLLSAKAAGGSVSSGWNQPTIDEDSRLCQIEKGYTEYLIIKYTGLQDDLTKLDSVRKENTIVAEVQRQCRLAAFTPFASIQNISKHISHIKKFAGWKEPLHSVENICTNRFAKELNNPKLFYQGGAKKALEFCKCREAELLTPRFTVKQCEELRDERDGVESEFYTKMLVHLKLLHKIREYHQLMSTIVEPDALNKWVNKGTKCGSINIPEFSPLLPDDKSIKHGGPQALKIFMSYLDKSTLISDREKEGLKMMVEAISRVPLPTDTFTIEHLNRELSNNLRKDCQKYSYYLNVYNKATKTSTPPDICTRHYLRPTFNQILSDPEFFYDNMRPYADTFYCETLRSDLKDMDSYLPEHFNSCQKSIAANIPKVEREKFIKNDGKVPLNNCAALKSDFDKNPTYPTDRRSMADRFGNGRPDYGSPPQEFSFHADLENYRNVPVIRVADEDVKRAKAKAGIPSENAEAVSSKDTPSPIKSNPATGSTQESTATAATPLPITPQKGGATGTNQQSNSEARAGYSNTWNSNRGVMANRPSAGSSSNYSYDNSTDNNPTSGESRYRSPGPKDRAVDRSPSSNQGDGSVADELRRMREEMSGLRREKSSGSSQEESEIRMAKLEKQIKTLKDQIKQQDKEEKAKPEVAAQKRERIDAHPSISTAPSSGKSALSPSSRGTGGNIGGGSSSSQGAASGVSNSNTIAERVSTGGVASPGQAAIGGGPGIRRGIASSMPAPTDIQSRISMVRQVVSQNQALDMSDFGLKLKENPQAFYEQTGGRVVVHDQENGRSVYRVMEFVIEGGVPRLLPSSIQTVDSEQVLDEQGEIIEGDPTTISVLQEQHIRDGLAEESGQQPISTPQERMQHDDVKSQLRDALSDQ